MKNSKIVIVVFALLALLIFNSCMLDKHTDLSTKDSGREIVETRNDLTYQNRKEELALFHLKDNFETSVSELEAELNITLQDYAPSCFITNVQDT